MTHVDDRFGFNLTSLLSLFVDFSGLSLQQNNETWINEYFLNRASTWQNWELSSDGGKIGFIPTATDPREIVLDFSFPQAIKSITMFYMKSYGPKWRSSEIHLSIFQEDKDVVLANRSLFGFHGKNTSEMYTEELNLLDPLPSHEKFHVRAHLTGGTTFKIMGLAVCS